ncbi:MAG: carbon-nitrogen family hydrolase [Clostridia bacterium]|nr:carbon-nitrogen family hydrolase [Clostridia bacterium]
MKISCLQMNMILNSPDENFTNAKKLIEKAAVQGTDTVILPETWNTGFFPKDNLELYCDIDGLRVKDEIGSLAKEYNINIIAGSVSNVKNGTVYNTSYVFSRNGECVAEYDKTHLFTPMHEDHYYKKGDHLCRFELDGYICGVLICYDIRFPELTRKLCVQGLDLLFLVSQWPKIRINHLLTLTKARAIENQIFVANCNSCGTAGDTVYGGNSSVHDPWGQTLVLAGEHEEIITAECDLSVLNEIRKTINVFADRRVELYK